MPLLDLRRLSHLVAVSEHSSIADAAASLRVSASSISVSVKKLEQSLGVTLVIRKPGEGVTMTPEGDHLVSEARSLLEQASEISESMSRIGGKPGGTIVVGSLVTVAPLVLPRLVAEYLRTGGSDRIKISTGAQDILIDRLGNAAIHLAVTYNINLPAFLDFEPLLDARPHVLLATSHRLSRQSSISLSDLADDPYISLDLPLSREYFFSLFMAAGLERKPDMSMTDLGLVRSAVGNGLGWSLVNMVPPTRQAPDGSEVVYVPLSTEHPMIRLGIATLSNRRLGTAATDFISTVRLVLPNRVWPQYTVPTFD